MAKLLLILLLASPTLLAQISAIHNVKGYTLNEQGELVQFSTLVFEDKKIFADNSTIFDNFNSLTMEL